MSKHLILSGLLTLLFLAPVSAQNFLESFEAPEAEEDVEMTEEDLEYRARFAIGQNFFDDLFLGTLNLDGQISFWRHWSIQLGARYNNWTWRPATEAQFENRQRTFYAGFRWWPWYSYSGWFVGSKVQWQEYNRGGILSEQTEEGDAFGLSVGGGYNVHVFPWMNVEFGLYLWGGATKYVTYACPYCGKRLDDGVKAFFLPDEARIAVQFIF